jgi:CHAT domain-containing protein/tetratricopeptide (TPR) repeat protein
MNTKFSAYYEAIFQDLIQQAKTKKAYYLKTGKLQDLNAVIADWEKILHHPEFTKVNPELRAGILNDSATILLRRYWATKNMQDLEQALSRWESLTIELPRNSSILHKCFSNLGTCLRNRYVHSGEAINLDAAIKAFQKAIKFAPKDSSDIPMLLNNLGNGLRTKYQHTGNKKDLEAAIKAFQKAVNILSDSSPHLAMLLDNLGNGLSNRYDYTGNMKDLNAAIEAYQKAVSITSHESPNMPRQLNNLGTGLSERYDCIGEVNDLEAAIKAYQQAVNLSHYNLLEVPTFLSNLATGIKKRYDRIGDMKDLDSVIETYQQAVKLTPDNAPDMPNHVNNLGIGLSARYKRIGEVKDLEAAIEAYQQAVNMTQKNAPVMPVYLTNLGSGLLEHYLHIGDMRNLETAIEVYQEAVSLTPSDSPNIHNRINNLGTGFSYRYARTGEIGDLESAIKTFLQAVELISDNSPERPRYLNNLGEVLRDYYVRTEEVEYLETAIEAFSRAVLLTPDNAPIMPSLLNSLGTGLRDYYTCTGDIQTLEEAIGIFQKAVNLIQADNSLEMSRHLNNLGTGLSYHYECTGEIKYLEEAIEIYQKSLALIPDDSPKEAGCINNLATALYCHYLHTEDTTNLKTAIQLFQQGAEIGLNNAVQDGLNNALNWLNNAFICHSWIEVKQAYNYAYKASEKLFQIQLLREHKESWLKDTQGLAAKSTYALAKNNKLQQAVVALESGLARLLSEALARDRADLEQLKTTGHADLYDRYQQTVEKWHFLTQQPEPEEKLRINRDELDATISAIQQIQGFEQFLKPPTFATIQQAAQNTTLIYILATEAGGLALLVGEKIIPVWLPALTDTNLHNILNNEDKTGYLDIYFNRKQNKKAWYTALDTTTSWLWQTVMAPIIDALPPQAKITLIPVGLLALLPLHAAWIKDTTKPTGKRYVLDDFSISYAPNALALTKAKSIIDNISSESLLAIDEPQPVQADSLPNSQYEVKTIAAQFKNAKTLEHNAASRTAVLDILPKNRTILHFSCHGKAYLNEPLKNGLLMSNHKEITLKDILNLRLQGIRLATLSACETGMIGTQLPDEFVNFSSGLLQAGCAGVVASLWSLSNNVSSMFLMIRFYEFWRQKHLEPPEALRQAQIWVRDSTNEEKFTYLEQAIEDTELSKKAIKRFKKELGFTSKAERSFAHPYYWAAFSYTGR